MNIRRKLTGLMLLIGLVPLLVVSAIAYITISKEITDRAVDQLSSISIKQEQKINALLQRKQEEAINFTNRYDLQVTVGHYLTDKKESDHETIRTLLRAKKADVTGIESIHITDLNNTVIASTTASKEGKVFENKPYNDNSSQESIITVHEDADGINKLFITTSINVNKKESAVLNIVFRIDDIVAAVQDYTGLGETGETLVSAQNQGGDAVSQFPLRFDTEAALKTKLNSLQLFSRSDKTYTDLVDYRGHHVMVATTYTGFADWVVAAKIDVSEALAPIAQLRNTLLAIVAISCLAITIIAFYFAKFYTQPILRIARISQLLGKGDFSARIDLQRNDELGALGKSINAMGMSLKDFVASVESQRNRLEVILNSTTEGILAIDKQGNIIIANHAAAELTQRPIEDMVGKNVQNIFIWTRELQPFKIDYNTASSTTYSDLQFINPAGATHYVKLIVAKATDDKEGDATAQTIITIHDETKSRELENMKVDFVSMAAHELRTPLAAIRGYLELISYKQDRKKQSNADATNDPSESDYLQQALNSTSELGGLINNLLGVTRIEKGTMTFNPARFDLAADLSQASKDANFSAQDKKILLTYNGPDNGCFVMADQISLHEVINNLLSNAIKYTELTGHVEVSLTKEKDNYVVRVKDTGIGIPKHALPNLFTKFYRVKGGLNSGSTGTGLGLFISKSIIERHNGTITVESQEGIGSVFTFTLPALQVATTDKDGILTTRGHRGWVTKNITR